MPISPNGLPSNEANILHLDFPISDPDELKQFIDQISNLKNQRIGFPVGIIKALELTSKHMCENWSRITHQYMLQNLSATSYFYTEIPDFHPLTADINHVYEGDIPTSDSPMSQANMAIAYDISKNMPGTLTRRAFGPNKEVGPRIRYYIETRNFQYPVSSQRKETIIEYRTYAHSGK